MYKNIDKQTKLQLKDQIEYQPGQVVSKTLVQNDKVSMTIFSFDKGEEISTHAAGGDAMVTVLEGTGRFTVGEEVFFLNEGETLSSDCRQRCQSPGRCRPGLVLCWTASFLLFNFLLPLSRLV